MPQTRRGLWRRVSRCVLACAALAAGFLAVTPRGSASAPSTVTWSTLNTAVSPPAVSGAAAAFDADSRNLVLFGGVTASGALSGTTWQWDGTSWSAVSPTAAEPPPRQLASMAFDPARHQLILFGGVGANGALLGDTWAWNGASWYELSSSSLGGPSPRAGAAFGYDTSHNLVLFGGMGSPAAAAASTTSPNPPGITTLPSPTATGQSATSTSRTTAVSTTSQPMVTQPARAAVGSGLATLDDTWIWNGSHWTQEHPIASPPARAGAAVASEPGSHLLTLFGGSSTPFLGPGASANPLDDTWEWINGTWVPQSPAARPPARYGAVFSYDTSIGSSVLFGGVGTTGTLGDTWTWNDIAWTPLTVAASPAPRSNAAGQFDSASRQLVVFGGADRSGNALADTDVLTATAPIALSPPAAAGGGLPTTTPPTSRPGAVASPPPATTSRPGARQSTPPGSARAVPTATTGAGPAPRKLRPGDVVILSGDGFRPRATITITFHSAPVVVGTATVAPNGTFSATVSVPARASAGAHSFEATGPNVDGQPISLWTPVSVLAIASSGGTSLSVTLAMVGIAIGIPVVSWLILGAWTSYRRDRFARH